MLAKYLWEAGSFIILFLGSVHLFFTFFTDKFSSQNKEMVAQMKTSTINLTPDTTIWKAWIGFNGSHSSGAIFIGLMNLYLAIAYFDILQADPFIFLFTIITIGFYVWLARKYWFSGPVMGISIALACFIASYVLTLVG